MKDTVFATANTFAVLVVLIPVFENLLLNDVAVFAKKMNMNPLNVAPELYEPLTFKEDVKFRLKAIFCEIFSIQELLTIDANLKTTEHSEENTRYMRVLLGILENVIMIAVKKSLILVGNLRATTWWVFSFSFSFIMFVQSVGYNMGGLLAILPSENDVTMRNSTCTKFALFICCLALYFVALFAFKPPEVPYFGEDVRIEATA